MMRRDGALLLVLLLAAVNRVAAEPLAYVALASARKLAIVDVGAGRAVRTFAVPVSPHRVAASPDGRLLFVPDLLLEKVIRVLDAETGRELRQIDAGAPVHHLTLSPDGRRLYATLTSVGRLAIVELASWTVRTVEVGALPTSPCPRRETASSTSPTWRARTPWSWTPAPPACADGSCWEKDRVAGR